jgi:hypothetical protein
VRAALVLDLLRFTPGPQPELAYEIEEEEVIGAGVARPHVFQVALVGNRVESARWVVDTMAGTFRRARSENFFDTEEPRILTFPAGSADIEELQGTVLALKPGLYEVRFAFYYSVAGIDRQQFSEPVLIYHEE